ncbi:MAG: methyltransferase domain-containing protein [Chrysiogenetes bacterium]|nr:methyltransferase domain-containing protein [Chrysiogenetes bacterium]
MSAPERYDPGDRPSDRLRLEHEARYAFAAQLAEERDLLDVGCGAGIGARTCIEAGAKSATLLDADEAACNLARDTLHGLKKVEIRHGAAQALPWRKPRFDLVLFLEIIEHLEDPRAALESLARVLRPRGVVVLSTPAINDPGNRHHLRCYETAEQLKDELRAVFAHVRIFSQQALCGSAIDAGKTYPRGQVLPTHWVALAGNDKLPSVKSAASWHELDTYEAATLRRLESDIAHLERERDALKGELSAMRRSLRWRITGRLARLLGLPE